MKQILAHGTPDAQANYVKCFSWIISLGTLCLERSGDSFLIHAVQLVGNKSNSISISFFFRGSEKWCKWGNVKSCCIAQRCKKCTRWDEACNTTSPLNNWFFSHIRLSLSSASCGGERKLWKNVILHPDFNYVTFEWKFSVHSMTDFHLTNWIKNLMCKFLGKNLLDSFPQNSISLISLFNDAFLFFW